MSRVKFLAVAALAGALAIGAPPASAKPMKIGFADNLFRSTDADTRAKWLKKSRNAGAKIARLEVFWRTIAPIKPLAPTNPNDPAYRWGTLDAAVADANANGLDPLLTVTLAPNWAEGPDRPGNVSPGRGSRMQTPMVTSPKRLRPGMEARSATTRPGTNRISFRI